MRTKEELAAIGRELVKERKRRVPWKLLERRFGNRRSWLHTLYLAALAELCPVDISAIAAAGDRAQGLRELEARETA